MWTKRWSCTILFSLIFSLLIPMPTFAQTADAEIEGTVTDASGASVPGAQIKLTNVDTGVARTLNAENAGHYRFSPVEPGTYKIEVQAPSFQTENVEHLLVNIGTHIIQNIALQLGNSQQVVNVAAEVPVIDTTSQDVSGVIDQHQITTLPVNTRQYLNLALLEPGTTQDGSRTFYNNVQVGGGTYFYANGFMIDGVRNTWAEQGEPRQNFPEGAVQEFKVYVAQYPAEYGLYMGGLVTIATKSGTNSLHGEVFEYWRNEALNHDNRFQQATEAREHTGNPFNRNQFGADIGGPIVKDRTHFYLSYERTQTKASYTIFTPLTQDYGALQGTFGQPSYDQMITARADHQISNTQNVFVRYAQEWNKLTYQGCGGSSEAYCYNGEIPRHSLVVGHTWTPSATVVNDFRFQYAYSAYLLGPPGTPIWTDPSSFSTNPAATAALQTAYYFPSFSYGAAYQEDGIEKRYEGNDVLSTVKGDHTLRLGFDINYVPFIDSTALNLKGTYTFSQDQPFNPSNLASLAALTGPILFTETLPSLTNSVPTWELGFFASDEWRIRPGLTVNLGLRYDKELGSFNENLNPKSFSTQIPYLGNPGNRGDSKDFGPRVGVAWDPWHNGKNVIRGGFGMYYNNIQTLQNFNELRDLAQCNIVISKPIYLNPFNGQNASNFCSTAPPNVTVLSQNYRMPYSEQFNLGYSHQFARDIAVSVNGVYEHYLHDFRVVDLNYPNAAGVRPLTAWGEILQHQSTAQSKYKALYVELDKRFSRRFQTTVSYTLASARDNNPQNSVTNYANFNQDWGPSIIDRRNSLVASGSVNLPLGVVLGVIWTVRSSLPFSAYENVFNANGTRQYVPGTSRDQGNRNLNLAAVNAYRSTLGLAAATAITGNPYNSLDLHLAKIFLQKEQRHLEIIGQCFNVFGHQNLLAANYVTNASSASFGTIGAASNLQQAELAARLVF